PIGIWGDLLNLGNGQTYTGGNPGSWVDPWGLSSGCPGECKDWQPSIWQQYSPFSRYYRDLLDAAGWINLGDPPEYNTVGNTNPGLLDAQARRDAAVIQGGYAADTALLVGSTLLPGPEDAVIGVVGASRLGGAIVGKADDVIEAVGKARIADDVEDAASNLPGLKSVSEDELFDLVKKEEEHW